MDLVASAENTAVMQRKPENLKYLKNVRYY
jgi:hypothetical protein